MPRLQLTWTVTNEFFKYIFIQVVTIQLLEVRECWGIIQAVAAMPGINCLLAWLFQLVGFQQLQHFFFPPTESESENRKAIK